MSSNLNAISSPLVLEPAPHGGALTQPHGGKRRFDYIGRAQMLPMLSRKVEIGDQALPVGGKRLDRLGVLSFELRLEPSPGGLAFGAALGIHHLVQCAFGARLKA